MAIVKVGKIIQKSANPSVIKKFRFSRPVKRKGVHDHHYTYHYVTCNVLPGTPRKVLVIR